MPEFFYTRSRFRLDGEEALLVFLHRMCYANRLNDMEFFFKRSYGYLSEMVEAVRVYLGSIAQKLVLQFDHVRLRPLLPVFAAALKDAGCPYPHLWAFLDGTFRDFCRPGRDGYTGLAQRVQYNGHKKAHENNHQGIETPDGIVAEMNGPNEGTTHDQKVLQRSGLLARVTQFCIALGIFYYLSGDKGYAHGNPELLVPYKGAALNPRQKGHNLTMPKFRQPVELSFGKVCVLFSFVDFKKNQKLYLKPVASYWQIACLLTNCHSSLYGNQTGQYFLVKTPKLEDYLRNGFN